MSTVTLGDIAEWGSGGTPKRGVPEYFGDGVPWLSIADLNDGVVAEAKESLTKSGIASSSAKVVPAGTLFVAMYGSIGKLGIAGREMCTSQAIAFAKPNSSMVDTGFLFHFLLAQRDALRARGRGGTQMNISQGDLKAWPISLPPIEEQRRVAAILDQAEAIRIKRRQILTEFDALTHSTFHAMFGDPSANPKGWPLARLGELSLVFRDGPFGSNLKSAHYVPEGIRVIRLQNIGVGKFIDNDAAFVTPEHFASLPKHRCMPGDVVIGTLGDPNLRACIVPEDVSEALNKADCVQMRVDPSRADAVWACWILNMPGTLTLAQGMIRGQTRARISMGQLRELRIPVPPLELQREFADRVAAIKAYRAVVEGALAADDELFASVQLRGFRGEL